MKLSIPFCAIFILWLVLLLTSWTHAQQESEVKPSTATIEDQWDVLLGRHLSRGIIDDIELTVLDYAAIAKDPDWKVLLKSLEATPVPTDRNEAMAYWINAYNILTVAIVLSEYPVDSIDEVGSILDPVWKMDAGFVGGAMRSLNEVEHEILRPMGDARIHAAVNCASLSCPDLRPEAFRASILDEQLDQQFTEFLANPKKGSVFNAKKNYLRLSRVFDWFRDDFEGSGGSREYAKKYLPKEVVDQMNEQTDVKFFSWDWELNDTREADELTAISSGPRVLKPI